MHVYFLILILPTCTLCQTQPLVTKELILRLQSCSDEELVKILEDTTVWRYGKVQFVSWWVGGHYMEIAMSALSVK